MSFDALAESCKSLLAMPTVRPNTGSSPAVSGTSVDVDKPPSFQFVSVSPKIERKPLAVPLMFGRTSQVRQPLAGKEPTMTWQLTVRFMLKREPIRRCISRRLMTGIEKVNKVAFRPRKVIQSTKRRPRYNPRRCGCWPASKFDAVDKAKGCGLNC